MNKQTLLTLVVGVAAVGVGYVYFETLKAIPQVAAVENVVVPSVIAESAPTLHLSDMQASTTLSGKWRSIDDPKFSREFREDGTVADRYEGEAGTEAPVHWRFVSNPANESIPLPVMRRAKIMRLDSSVDPDYFAITELTPKRLTMVYLSGNGTLRFTKVKSVQTF